MLDEMKQFVVNLFKTDESECQQTNDTRLMHLNYHLEKVCVDVPDLMEDEESLRRMRKRRENVVSNKGNVVKSELTGRVTKFKK